jgi:hypothetical protein
MDSNVSNTRRKRTPTQKKILKMLIEYDLRLEDVADYHGHTTGNASVHLLRENEHYFTSAIQGMRKSKAVAS